MNLTPSTRNTPVVIFALSTTILALLPSCPAPPQQTETAFSGPSIIIEDEHAGVWMPFDNAFTKPPNVDWPDFKNKRAGFLFQSGRFFRYQLDNTILYYDKADTVNFSKGLINVPLVRGSDWDWINIVGEYTGYSDPITWDYAGLLFPSGVHNEICDVGDGCVQLNNPLTAPASCADTLDKQPRPCVRLRSIHAYFEPGGIITYWQGKNGYDLSVARRSASMAHNMYTFKLKDSITIEIWKGGARNGAAEALLTPLGNNPTITIKGPPTTPHGETDNPPTGPKPR